MQLMDLMGTVQTTESHEAALKVLDFKSEAILDLNERYLWSLSLSSHPSSHIIKGEKQSYYMKFYFNILNHGNEWCNTISQFRVVFKLSFKS